MRTVGWLPMGTRVHVSFSSGFGLIELLVVLAIIGVCAAVASITLGNGLSGQAARGAAQSWQAAAAWAQVGVLWHGGSSRVIYSRVDLTVAHDFDLCGGKLGATGPMAPVTTNVSRWDGGEKATVAFGGALASPDSGGSLYFHGSGSAYRVVVRPESGLSVRSREDEER